ncbi:hypothetical protein HL658_14020 [Azospirillum sp. RWY-5-1]|uniref:DSBA-like thioredoxin domain-containing protein n=1 Tax=Azospirillum oleiclasticum TaxID=2735135 RepID=A0ABX2T9L5_9PROT|nr:DsbA family protein [Azospirillum oleiclasticum]NYZ13666.1 hypothetical protein [Azospirillum oleiclasticum]NYZ20938.1 hypothetical protein [Azospirillum oleiclasticum]
MHATRDPALLTVFHRADDPWSLLLLQALPRLSEIHSVAFRFVTVPLAGPDHVPRPAMLMANGLRDAVDLARHHPLVFPRRPVAPDAGSVALATRMLLAQPDPRSYLDCALALGQALFAGDAAAVADLCKSRALPTPEEADAMLAEAGRAQRRLGHYHSGMILFEGGWYWGIDRLYHLEQALIALGHRRPTGVPGCLPLRDDPELPDVGGPERDADGTAVLRYYCSFRSPYAYIAADRAFALARRYRVRVDPRLIIPMKMAGFAIPAEKAGYFRFDCAREGLRHGVRFGRFTDPFGDGLRRAMAIVPHAMRTGKGEAYILSVMRGVWADGLDTARDDDLARMCGRAGLDPAAAMRHADPSADLGWADRHREELAQHQQYAAPVFVIGDYMTWGQDRLPILERVLDHAVGRR